MDDVERQAAQVREQRRDHATFRNLIRSRDDGGRRGTPTRGRDVFHVEAGPRVRAALDRVKERREILTRGPGDLNLLERLRAQDLRHKAERERTGRGEGAGTADVRHQLWTTKRMSVWWSALSDPIIGQAEPTAMTS